MHHGACRDVPGVGTDAIVISVTTLCTNAEPLLAGLATALQGASDAFAEVATGLRGASSEAPPVGGEVPVDALGLLSGVANADYQALGRQMRKLFAGLAAVDWPQVYFSAVGEAPTTERFAFHPQWWQTVGTVGHSSWWDDWDENQLGTDDLHAFTVYLDLLSQVGGKLAVGMPPPITAPQEPACINAATLPSLPDILLTNMDAGHLKAAAAKAVDFSRRLSTVSWGVRSSHATSCVARRRCSDIIVQEDCNPYLDGYPDSSESIPSVPSDGYETMCW